MADEEDCKTCKAVAVVISEVDGLTEPLRSNVKAAVQAIADRYTDGDISRVGLSVNQDGAKAYVDGNLVDMEVEK